MFAFVSPTPATPSSSLTHSAFTSTAPRPSARPRISCVSNFRSRLLRVRATATGADGHHPSQSIPTDVGDASAAASAAAAPEKTQKLALIGVLFLAITYFWSIVLFIPMALAHPFVMWRDQATRRFHDFIAMAWMKCSFGSVLVRPNIINAHNLLPKDTPVVYVANHSSYLDIYSFAYLRRRIKYVSKAEIFKLPIVGWAMEMAGNIALRRMNRRGQMEAYRKMVAVVKNGLSLVIFPEGTRSASGKMRKFQSGGFRAAKQQNAPVVPVTILGTREVMPAHAWVPLRYPTKPISLVVHPPLDTSNLSVHELQDCAYEAIDSALPPEAQTRPLIKHAKDATRNF